MATVLTPGMIIRASAWCVDGSQASANVFHFLVGVVGGLPATDQDFANTFDAAIASLYKLVLNNNAAYRGVLAQIIFPLPVRVAVQTAASAGAGTGGATAQPKQVSGLTSWYTAVAGRSGRGRTYWPFPPTAFDIADGTPSASYVTAIDNIASAIQGFTLVSTGGRTANVTPSIYHRGTGGTQSITVRLSRTQWATQRRRGGYGRLNISPV